MLSKIKSIVLIYNFTALLGLQVVIRDDEMKKTFECLPS